MKHLPSPTHDDLELNSIAASASNVSTIEHLSQSTENNADEATLQSTPLSHAISIEDAPPNGGIAWLYVSTPHPPSLHFYIPPTPSTTSLIHPLTVRRNLPHQRQHLGHKLGLGHLPLALPLALHLSRRHPTPIRPHRRPLHLPIPPHRSFSRSRTPTSRHHSHIADWSGIGQRSMALRQLRNADMASVSECRVLFRVRNGVPLCDRE